MKILVVAVSIGLLISVYRGYYLKGIENEQTLKAVKTVVEAKKARKIAHMTESTENTVRNKVKIININTAGKVDLQSIPGIGPVTADRIMEFRKQAGGRIRNLKHLQKVKGIGPKTAEKIEPYVIF